MFYYYLTLLTPLLYWLRCSLFNSAHTSNVSGVIFKLIVVVFVFSCILMISVREISIVEGVYYGGIDALAYKEIFEGAGIGFWDSIQVQFYEPGYAALVWFFSKFVGSYELYQVLIYSFFFLSYFFYSRHLNKSWYSFFALMLMSFYFIYSLNTLRVIFAVFLSMFILFLLPKKRYVVSILLSLICFSIHVSSIVLLLFIFFDVISRKSNRVVYCFVLAGAFLLSLMAAKYLIPLYIGESRLLAYSNQAGDISYGTMLAVTLFMSMVAIRYNDIVAMNPYNRFMVVYLSTFFLVVPVFYYYPIAYRLFLFYLPVLYFLIPSILKCCAPLHRKNFLLIPLWLSGFVYILGKIYVFYTVEVLSAGNFALLY